MGSFADAVSKIGDERVRALVRASALSLRCLAVCGAARHAKGIRARTAVPAPVCPHG
jgi:hypothetical protein